MSAWLLSSTSFPPVIAATPAPVSAARPLDAVGLDRVVRRLHAAGSVPWLHAEAARRMAERLSIVRLQPQRILAWAALVGGGAAELRQAYPGAELVTVEPEASARVPAARPWWARLRAQVTALDPQAVPAAAGQLLWSNMGLHGCADPKALMRRWHEVLAVDGFLMFSTLGPGTLQPLRELYRSEGWSLPHAPFVDMHDLGDMLVEAGFADPVMDQETITLTWESPQAALAELRSLGGNVAQQRHAGLRTPRWHKRLLAVMGAQLAGADGRVALPFELVYGHAFRPLPRLRLGPETSVSLDDMRSLVRTGTRRA